MRTFNSRFIPILNTLFLTLTISISQSVVAADHTKAALIPKPVSVKTTGGYFELKKQCNHPDN